MCFSFANADELEEEVWKSIAFAGRYGHQPILTEMGPMTLDRLNAFNDGLGFWLKKENEKGPEYRTQEYLATGGG